MDNVVRLLMRFLLVPLGYLVAAVAATAVVLIAWWQLADAAGVRDPEGIDVATLGLVVSGPILLMVMLVFILVPVAIGILVSEAFAIRSWIFHGLNGIVSVWVGWQLFGGEAGTGAPIEQPLLAIAAGIAAGFAYWAVAGSTAGFYKPVFRSGPPPPMPAATR